MPQNYKLMCETLVSDLILMVIGPLLFFAGIYISSWFLIGLCGLLAGVKLCMRESRSALQKRVGPDSVSQAVKNAC